MKKTILSRIHSDHKKIEEDISLILNTHDQETKKGLFEKLKARLVSHIESEEYSIYRHFREEIEGGADLDFVIISESEHHCVKEYLQRLNLLSIKSPNWDKSIRELSKILKHYIVSQENEMFQKAKEDFSKEELIKFGMEYEQFKLHTKKNKSLL